MIWLAGPEAAAAAARLAARYRVSGYDAAVENLVAEASYQVWRRQQSAEPMQVRSPAAYGTTTIQSVLLGIIRARSKAATALPEWLAEVPEPEGDGRLAGRTLRASVRTADPHPAWLPVAVEAYIDLALGDLILPDGAPQPRAGATPAQARAWAALWIAGVRDVFPAGRHDPRRRTRARRVQVLLDHLQEAQQQLDTAA
jgi:hypothetical protein